MANTSKGDGFVHERRKSNSIEISIKEKNVVIIQAAIRKWLSNQDDRIHRCRVVKKKLDENFDEFCYRLSQGGGVDLIMFSKTYGTKSIRKIKFDKDYHHLTWRASMMSLNRNLRLTSIYKLSKEMSKTQYTSQPERKSYCFALHLTGNRIIDFEAPSREIWNILVNGFERLILLIRGESSNYIDFTGVPRRALKSVIDYALERYRIHKIESKEVTSGIFAASELDSFKNELNSLRERWGGRQLKAGGVPTDIPELNRATTSKVSSEADSDAEGVSDVNGKSQKRSSVTGGATTAAIRKQRNKVIAKYTAWKRTVDNFDHFCYLLYRGVSVSLTTRGDVSFLQNHELKIISNGRYLAWNRSIFGTEKIAMRKLFKISTFPPAEILSIGYTSTSTILPKIVNNQNSLHKCFYISYDPQSFEWTTKVLIISIADPILYDIIYNGFDRYIELHRPKHLNMKSKSPLHFDNPTQKTILMRGNKSVIELAYDRYKYKLICNENKGPFLYSCADENRFKRALLDLRDEYNQWDKKSIENDLIIEAISDQISTTTSEIDDNRTRRKSISETIHPMMTSIVPGNKHVTEGVLPKQYGSSRTLDMSGWNSRRIISMFSRQFTFDDRRPLREASFRLNDESIRNITRSKDKEEDSDSDEEDEEEVTEVNDVENV